jgi:hypothetical protein
MLSRAIAYARNLATRRRREAEADEEIAFHLEHETAANIARGLSPAEAQRLARAHLGGVMQTREAVRDVRRTTLDGLWSDFRHACRGLRAAPSFTLVAVGTLTLALGASTAIVSIVDAVILRGLPFPRADRLIAIGEARRSEISDRTREPGRAAELPRLACAADGLRRHRRDWLRQRQSEGGWRS